MCFLFSDPHEIVKCPHRTAFNVLYAFIQSHEQAEEWAEIVDESEDNAQNWCIETFKCHEEASYINQEDLWEKSRVHRYGDWWEGRQEHDGGRRCHL